MNNNFSPESTNPRQRRAYAHALRDKAIVSGEPKDKVAAVEAAKSASATSKGKDLGHQALTAFRRSTGKELRAEPSQLRVMHTHTTFTDEVSARAHSVVAEIEGQKLGVLVRVEKPEDKDGYVSAVRRSDYSRVKNLTGMVMYEPSFSDEWRAVPADTPKSETAIQSVADYHLNEGTHVVDVATTQSAENFYANVEAITKPHGDPTQN